MRSVYFSNTVYWEFINQNVEWSGRQENTDVFKFYTVIFDLDFKQRKMVLSNFSVLARKRKHVPVVYFWGRLFLVLIRPKSALILKQSTGYVKSKIIVKFRRIWTENQSIQNALKFSKSSRDVACFQVGSSDQRLGFFNE